jgi:ectoine hydroxylase-related dioxygenase (phytanoyl-CoA dioxygenase family)
MDETWHQDGSIQVKEKIETEGFHSWTDKAGVIRVVPPLEYLQSAYALRIHLNDVDGKNGALKVVLQTHFNLLPPEEIARLGETEEARCCPIRKGSVQVLKPLTIHATCRMVNGKPGRVIQLEFNCRELPGGLEWPEKDNLTRTFER